MINDLKLDYFPTRREMVEYYGDEKLTNKVCKTLGYYGWAKELGMPVKDNDTKTGKMAEKYVYDILSKRGYRVEQMLQNFPYDLLINGKVKVDVKFSHLYRSPNGFGFYSFRLSKKCPTCDFYILVTEDETGDRELYVVPAAKAAQTQISIGEHASVYHQYMSRYDYLDKLLDLYKALGG